MATLRFIWPRKAAILLIAGLLQACVGSGVETPPLASNHPAKAFSSGYEVEVSDAASVDHELLHGRLLGGMQSSREGERKATAAGGVARRVDPQGPVSPPTRGTDVRARRKALAQALQQPPTQPAQVKALLAQLTELLALEERYAPQAGEKSAQAYLEQLQDLPTASEADRAALLQKAYGQAFRRLLRQRQQGEDDPTALLALVSKAATLDQQQGACTGKDDHYADAAVLYQVMLQVAQKAPRSVRERYKKVAYEGLLQVRKALLPSEPTFSLAALKAQIAQDRKVLHDLRAAAQKQAAALEALLHQKDMTPEEAHKAEEAYITGSEKLFAQVAHTLKEFLMKLYGESEQAVGPAPCQYAVMGLGSMALQQITPHSDLEFAILMGKPKDEAQAKRWQAYFRHLSQVVHFRVINLGETVVAMSKYGVSLDSLCTMGCNFDLGGKTPLGRRDKPYGLIQTVDQMLHYLRDDSAERADKFLPFILENSCYVCGDKALYEAYQNGKQTYLNTSIEGNTVHRQRALKILVEGFVEKQRIVRAGDLQKLQPQFHAFDAGRLYNVKQEIYRLPDRLLYGLALYHGIFPHSAWDAVAQLAKQGIIDSGAARHHLRYAVSFATMLRLKTYLHHGQQAERIALARGYEDNVQHFFVLPREALQAEGSLFKYYYAVLPLHARMRAFFDHPKSLHAQAPAFFKTAPFYDNRPQVVGKIHYRLLAVPEAQKAWEKALARQQGLHGPPYLPMLSARHHDLGLALAAQGQYRQALTHHQAARQHRAVFQGVHNAPDITPHLASSEEQIGRVYALQGQYAMALAHCQKALAQYEAYYKDKKHAAVASSYHTLGTIYTAQGQYAAARKAHAQALQLRKALYGRRGSPAAAASHAALGGVYLAQGQYKAAQDACQKALAMRLEAYGQQAHPILAESYDALGDVHQAWGDYPTALAAYEQALEMRLRLYGRTPHPALSVSDGKVGALYQHTGAYSQALLRYEQALKRYEQPHPHQAHLHAQIGTLYAAQGQYAQALAQHEKSLKLCAQFYGERHPALAARWAAVGAVYALQGDYSKAMAEHERALELLLQVHGEQPHPGVAHAYQAIGTLYRRQGKLDKALDRYERARRIFTKVYAGQQAHPAVASLELALGQLYALQQAYDKAHPCCQRALKICQQVYGQHAPPALADCYTLRGELSVLQEDYAEAQKQYEHAHDLLLECYGNAPHPAVGKSHVSLGKVYARQGAYERARGRFEQALALFTKVYEDQPHPDVAAAQAALGQICQAQEDHKAALDWYAKAQDVLEAVYGAQAAHPALAQHQQAIGAFYYAAGDAESALDYYQKALEMSLTLYGSTAPQVAALYTALAQVYEELVCDGDKALGYYERAHAGYQQSLGAGHQATQKAWETLQDVRAALAAQEALLAAEGVLEN